MIDAKLVPLVNYNLYFISTTRYSLNVIVSVISLSALCVHVNISVNKFYCLRLSKL
jgi:hypothetical protein